MVGGNRAVAVAALACGAHGLVTLRGRGDQTQAQGVVEEGEVPGILAATLSGQHGAGRHAI